MKDLISIVDDDAPFRQAMSQLVRSLGHLVATFESAEDFLASQRICETACLITDVRMPGMGGLELQDRLRAAGHYLPVIFVAASPGAATREHALAGGALAFLSKPFPEDSLVALLGQVMPARP